jgi:hypothetical protein
LNDVNLVQDDHFNFVLPTSLTLNPNFGFLIKIQILYIKGNMVVSVCVDKNWAVPGRFFQSLPVPCGARSLSVVTNRPGQGRAGRPGQSLRGAGRGAISIKEILGENRGTCI